MSLAFKSRHFAPNIIAPGAEGQLRPDPFAILHDSVRGVFKKFYASPRNVPFKQPHRADMPVSQASGSAPIAWEIVDTRLI